MQGSLWTRGPGPANDGLFFYNGGHFQKYAIDLGRGELAISHHLGQDAVCTLPQSCKEAASSPAAPEAVHYSYGHWVEDDPLVGDGAFSSPGYFGFYPFIDASKTYYGIVARDSLMMTAYRDSVKCGRAIRAAFMHHVSASGLHPTEVGD